MKLNLKIIHPKFFTYGILFALTITIADLLSKELIFALLDKTPGQHIRVTSFFNLVKVYNTGVSFGMFNDLQYGKIILIIVASMITIFLLYWLSQSEDKKIILALSLVIGGALGNIIDRAIYGSVADFLDFHINGYHWPAFNLADSSITLGAIILIFDEFFNKKKHD
ncbi:MAG: signal peptidase II [Alphaproteobacteria bacterium]|jgi:signal peptidase II|nr:signal peptidase II [Alphaproteobacteria bacterium]MBT5828124.1 signal peptidase II [Alphaproteobacteria bacterium]